MRYIANGMDIWLDGIAEQLHRHRSMQNGGVLYVSEARSIALRGQRMGLSMQERLWAEQQKQRRIGRLLLMQLLPSEGRF